MFTHFHKLLQLFGGRCIIVEEGEARYVVLPIKEYLSLSGKRGERDNPGGEDILAKPDLRALERINQEIEWASKADAVDVPERNASRRLSEATTDAIVREGGANNERSDEDAGARRYGKSGRDLSGEPGAKREGEGAADDRAPATEDAVEPRVPEAMPERSKSEYRIEDIPF